MDKAVEIHGRLVDLEEVLVVEIFGFWTLSGKDHLHGFVEVLNLLSETVEIEIVADVVLVYFYKEFVAFEVAEPGDPACAAFRVIVVVKIVCIGLN